MKYENPQSSGTSEVEAAIERDEPQELAAVVIGVSLYAPDLEWAQAVCIQLAAHANSNIRGNAILGFGHLARRFGRLNQVIVQPLIATGWPDPDKFVRSQAQSASDDVSHFLKWKAGKASA